MGQYCFVRCRLSSVVVVCNAAGGRAGRPPGRARGRSGGRHCKAGQYGYVLKGRNSTGPPPGEYAIPWSVTDDDRRRQQTTESITGPQHYV